MYPKVEIHNELFTIKKLVKLMKNIHISHAPEVGLLIPS